MIEIRKFWNSLKFIEEALQKSITCSAISGNFHSQLDTASDSWQEKYKLTWKSIKTPVATFSEWAAACQRNTNIC